MKTFDIGAITVVDQTALDGGGYHKGFIAYSVLASKDGELKWLTTDRWKAYYDSITTSADLDQFKKEYPNTPIFYIKRTYENSSMLNGYKCSSLLLPFNKKEFEDYYGSTDKIQQGNQEE